MAGELVKAGERPPDFRVARSLSTAAPGEVLLVGKRGELIGAAALRNGWLRYFALVTAVGALEWMLVGPAGPALLAVVIGALLAWRMRHRGAIRRAVTLISAGRRDEAEAAVAHLTELRLSRASQPMVHRLAAAVALQRGRFPEALAAAERALASAAGTRYHVVEMALSRSLVAMALIQLDRLDDARQVRAALAGAGNNELFDLMRQALDLALAFHADRPADLPDDATLHDWARAALGRTRYGGIVAYLAWAFHRRGDDDMARHLLAEAPARLEGEHLVDQAPKLHAWMEERAREWELEA